MYRTGYVMLLYHFAALHIRRSPCHLDYAVIGTGGEAESVEYIFKQLHAVLGYGADLLEKLGRDACVAGDARPRKALRLYLPCRLYTLAYGGGALLPGIARQLAERGRAMGPICGSHTPSPDWGSICISSWDAPYIRMGMGS